MMAKKFSELVARMSPEDRAQAEAMTQKMLAAMPLSAPRRMQDPSRKMLTGTVHAQQPVIAKHRRAG
jgi:hypothetical protein